MRGVNKVILVGTLGKDPETKTFPNGGSLTQFSIATSESWTDKTSGERKEQTEWHRIVLPNRLGEIAQQYLHKGSKVYIEGSLRTRQWTDQNGQERYSTEVRGDSMQMLDSRQQSDQGGNDFNQPRFNNNNAQSGGYQNTGYNNNNSNSYGQGGGFNGGNQGFQQPSAQTIQPKGIPPQTATAAPADLDDDLPF